MVDLPVMTNANDRSQSFGIEYLSELRAHLPEGIILHVQGLGCITAAKKVGSEDAIAGTREALRDIVPNNGCAGKSMEKEERRVIVGSRGEFVGICVPCGENKSFVLISLVHVA
jgi:hypothetical protein